MDEQRVMEVWCPAWKQTGSGYLVTDSLILTAYHNVRHDGQASDGLQVRQLDRNGQTTWLAAERIWPEHEPDLTQDPSADAALLQIVDPSWDPAKLSPVRWGRVVGTDRIPCKSLGFPDAEKRPDNTRDTMPIRGHLEPLHAMKTSLLTIHVNEGIVPKRLAQGSGWAGMSGAAVFCGPLLTGILITEHDIADSNEVLFAVPITSLRATPGFTPTLRAAGGNPDVENINGAPAAPYTGSLNPQLDAAVLYVGNESLNYWREEAPYRGLLESPALNLRWSTAEARLMDRTSNGKLPDGKACSPTEAAAAYRAIGCRRLVVLGEEGAGKTGWAALMVLGLLEERGPREPIPFLASLSPNSGPWNPDRDHFYTWLAQQLVKHYPGLANIRAYGVDAAKNLLISGQVVPMLDGLDELPHHLQLKTVRALNKQMPSTTPLVITCRTKSYKRMAGNDVLQNAKAIELQPLTPADIIDFLKPRHTTSRWNPVFNELLRSQGNKLLRALSTPLMAALARTVYAEETSDPSELTDTARFRNRKAIEEHLIDSFIPAIFATASAPRFVTATKRTQWDPEKSREYLTFLAGHLNDTESSKLEWWEFRKSAAKSAALRFSFLCTHIILATLFGTIADMASFELSTSKTGGALTTLLIISGLPLTGMALKYVADPDSQDPKRLTDLRTFREWFTQGGDRPQRIFGFMSAFTFATALGITSAVAMGIASGVTVGILGAVMVLLSHSLGTPAATVEATTPRNLLRADRTTAFIPALSAILFTIFIGMMMSASTYEKISWATVISLCTLFGEPTLRHAAWAPFSIVRVWQALSRKTPLRLFRFLEDAHHLGVLRQVGGAYEFRHSRLQQRLAASSKIQVSRSVGG